MLIASLPSIEVALLNGVHIESKHAVSVEKSPESNVLCIMLLTSSPSGYYKVVGEKRETLKCGFPL